MHDDQTLLLITAATDEDREWGTVLMSGMDPWHSLGVSQSNILANFFDPSYDVFIAKINQQRAGVMLIDRRGLAGSPYLKSIAVEPSFHGQGTGTQMLQFAENFGKKYSPHFFLCVSSFNKAAQHFYFGQGYTQVGELTDYLKKGASELLLYKRLE